MKTILIYTILLLSTAHALFAQVSLDTYYGLGEDFLATEHKSYNNFSYVSGTVPNGIGGTNAIFSKFDNVGNKVWEVILDQETVIQDFEYDQSEEKLILVGHKDRFSDPTTGPNDNESFVMVIDDKSGVCDCQNVYPNTGRETFNRIVLHPNPLDSNFPFYALGAYNDPMSLFPNGSNDFVMLYNFDIKCASKWKKGYRITGVDDNEFGRGLIPLGDGNLFLVGNDSPSNNGIIVKVNGLTGSDLSAFAITSGDYDLYDGYEIDEKNVVLIGADFANKNAIMINMSRDYIIKDAINYEQIHDFTSIGVDEKLNIYSAGYSSKGNQLEAIITRINLLPSGVFALLTAEEYLVIPTIGLKINDPSIYRPNIFTSPDQPNLTYSDNRAYSSGTGAFLGIFELNNMTSSCLIDTMLIKSNFIPILEPRSLKVSNILNVPIQSIFCSNTSFLCSPACSPCNADFEVSVECLNVSITDMSSSSLNDIVSWQWDLDCNGNIEYTVQNPSFDLKCGIYDMCLYITTASGCIDTIMKSFQVEESCLSIPLEAQEICATDLTASILIPNCSGLVGATQVDWFISESPCNSNWTNIYSGGPCDPLNINPTYHNGDLCVYAVVSFGASNPCNSVNTDTVMINLCQPINCSIPSQEYCYLGTPVTPSTMTLNISGIDNCMFDIQWYKDGVALPGETGMSLTPGPINWTLPSTDCFEKNYSYTAEVSNICGMHTCTAEVTLYNDNADIGDIDIGFGEPPLPFCPGEDAVLLFTPECIGIEDITWTWNTQLDPLGGSWIPLNNGDRSPKYNTNRIWESTWFQVEAQNGVCSPKTEDILIEVVDEVTITSFTADHNCSQDEVSLIVDYTQSSNTSNFPNCDHTIEWYRNDQLIFSNIYQDSPAQFTYTGPKEGNYQVVVTNNCCSDEQVYSDFIYVPAQLSAVIAGPCYRCNTEEIVLEALISDADAVCTIAWTDLNTGVSLGSNSSITITPDIFGPIGLEMNCGSGCVVSDQFEIKQCGENPLNSIDLISLGSPKVYPNPATTSLTIEFQNPLPIDCSLTIRRMVGDAIFSRLLEKGIKSKSVDLSVVNPGMYILEIRGQNGILFSKTMIKI